MKISRNVLSILVGLAIVGIFSLFVILRYHEQDEIHSATVEETVIVLSNGTMETPLSLLRTESMTSMKVEGKEISMQKTQTMFSNAQSSSDKHSILKRKKKIRRVDLVFERSKDSNISSVDALSECVNMKKKYQVVPEVSWGRIQHFPDLRNKWQSLECNTVLKTGRSSDCSEIHGEKFVRNWKNNSIPLCQDSQSYCRVSIRDNIQCRFDHIILDFRKLEPAIDDPRATIKRNPPERTFNRGFATSYCTNSTINEKFPYLKRFGDYFPGLDIKSQTNLPNLESICDVQIKEPVMIVSHDNVLNLGHLMEDLLNWWLMVELSGLDSKNISIISIDGMRPGTILNGKGRFILTKEQFDNFGPFTDIFRVLFRNTYSAGHLWGSVHEQRTGKRVCLVGGVYTYPMPLKAFLWEKFEVEDPCSKVLSPSYIYRKFVYDYHHHWRIYGNLQQHQKEVWELLPKKSWIWYHYHPSSANDQSIPLTPFRSTDMFRVLIVKRKPITSGNTPEIAARSFANLEEIRISLVGFFQSMKFPIEIIAVDFEDISFAQQVALSHSIDLLVGFHGAGMNHLFHMNYRRPRCCGVVEIFPQTKGCDPKRGKDVCVYYKRIGHGNHARYLGYHYNTIVASDKSFGLHGTTINPVLLAKGIAYYYEISKESMTHNLQRVGQDSKALTKNITIPRLTATDHPRGTSKDRDKDGVSNSIPSPYLSIAHDAHQDSLKNYHSTEDVESTGEDVDMA